MKLWMSAEMMADVADDYRAVRKIVESEINHKLQVVGIDDKIKDWTFIAIILEEENLDYPEVAKKNKKGTDLEFRLKINHQDFLTASKQKKISMLLDSLSRSINLMADMDVLPSTITKLREAIASTTNAVMLT